jgi:hypothetical protein
MGDYETLNIDFGIEDDVREGEKASECFDRLYGFVFKRLDAEVDKARQVKRV